MSEQTCQGFFQDEADTGTWDPVIVCLSELFRLSSELILKNIVYTTQNKG